MVIYKLTSPSSKVYIGKSKNHICRWNEHKRRAEKGLKGYLYEAIRKYGWLSFKKEIIDRADTEEELSIKEIYWISFYEATNPDKGYNITPGGTGGNIWQYLSEEKRDEIRKKRLPVSEEQKRKMSEIMKSKFLLIPHWSKGTRWHKKNKPIPWNKGLIGVTKLSKETREKMSKSHLGKGRYAKTEEHKQKLSEANLGKTLSDETRARMSASRKGHISGIGEVTCPYCGKVGKSNAMFRWHFNNCKEKK